MAFSPMVKDPFGVRVPRLMEREIAKTCHLCPCTIRMEGHQSTRKPTRGNAATPG